MGIGLTGYVLVLRCDGIEEELFSLCQKEQALDLVDEMRREFPQYCFSLCEEYRVADDDPRG